MGLADVAPSIHAMNRAIVLKETWGHLEPEPRRKYNGSILFTLGTFGDITVIDKDFEDLPDSPWFYEYMHDYIGDYCLKNGKEGSVYLFTGWFQMFKNRGCRFVGQIVTIIGQGGMKCLK